MTGFDSDHDESSLPKFSDRGDIIRFLEQTDIALPDGLTVEKTKSRGSWWAIDNSSFSFRIERHPSGPFSATSSTKSRMPTPARWHIRKRYAFDLTTGEWDMTEQMREFEFDPGLLVDVEFEHPPTNEWDRAIACAREADDPTDVISEQLAATEQRYRNAFTEIPNEQLAEMLTVLEDALRHRAGLD